MNLLTTQWIPVIKADGSAAVISPAELTVDFSSNPIKFFNAARADFNGALAQFLIGLLQTALLLPTVLPEFSKGKWEKWYQQPPTTAELANLLQPLTAAFEFNDKSPSFMQDYALPQSEKKSIAALFIEQPGQQTLELNTDHFIKRHSINQLCQNCAVMALFTLQINAPSGGAGHRTSVRGGGPLTTLVISDNEQRQSLWHLLWLNVLPAKYLRKFLDKEDVAITDLNTVFPWLIPTRTSEKESEAMLPQDAHFLQSYWCMPRRIRIDFQDTVQGKCDVCGQPSEQLIQSYFTKNYGINYKEGWVHPLSPYRFDDKQMPIPLHPQPDGIGYKYWQAIVLDEPATPIKMFNVNSDNQDKNIKIWAFGYDMDNMKARAWYETEMPFYRSQTALPPTLIQENVSQYLKVAQLALKFLRIALQATNAPIKTAEIYFWQITEAVFYKILQATIDVLDKDISNDLKVEKVKWLNHLRQQALAVFEHYINLQHSQPIQIQKITKAKKELKMKLYGPKIRNELGLEKEEAK